MEDSCQPFSFLVSFFSRLLSQRNQYVTKSRESLDICRPFCQFLCLGYKDGSLVDILESRRTPRSWQKLSSSQVLCFVLLLMARTALLAWNVCLNLVTIIVINIEWLFLIDSLCHIEDKQVIKTEGNKNKIFYHLVNLCSATFYLITILKWGQPIVIVGLYNLLF